MLDRGKYMSSKNKKLVALLGGRPYIESLTLRLFLTPAIRQQLSDNGIDFIIATNNLKSADQFEQIKGLKVVRTSPELHEEFMSRQREVKTNLGAETRETINDYAKKNGYDYALHLDDNIKSIFYHYTGKNRLVKKHKPQSFFEMMMLLFYISEHSNTGTVGYEMSAFAPAENPRIRLTAGFPYSFFVQKVDQNYKFENSTEDDILMNIYNGVNHKPSSIVRNALLYGKTGKSDKKAGSGGNRKLYKELLKENKRGEYASKMFPKIYSRKVSYMVKSSTIQKEPMLQHKHKLIKPKLWDNQLEYDDTVIDRIKQTVAGIVERELS